MTIRINKRWCIAIVATIIFATLGGLLVIAVQQVRTSAARTSDI